MAIIGAGRVGTSLGVLLERAGHPVMAASGGEDSRQRARLHLPRTRFFGEDAVAAAAAAPISILAVPDGRMAPTCEAIAAVRGPGTAVIHLSGALGLDVLAPAAARGASVLSMHPLQTVPDVETGIRRLPGSSFAITARDEPAVDLGEQLARDAGGRPFRLAEDAKPLYHAAAVFCSNYLVAVEGLAESLFRLAGLEEPLPLFEPLARAALDATFARGPGAALTGPVVRGDAASIRMNLEALERAAPHAVPIYVELATEALGQAVAGGRIDGQGATSVEEVLAGWR